MTAPRNVNRCSPCLEGEHRRCSGSAGNIGCGCVHAAPAPQYIVPDPEVTDADRQRARVLWRAARFADPADAPDGPEEVIAAALAEGRERALRPFRDLFAGGPDTTCRTTYREGAIPECSAASIDCVEVPLDDLRAAFVEAGESE